MKDRFFIDIQALAVSYGRSGCAIENVTLKLEPGKIYGLVGMNGAGKSTLFKAIMGLLSPQSGDIKICGQSVARALKANHLAYVPQSESIDWDFPVLVRDVVMMGRYGYMNFMRRASEADHRAVDSALARVGLSDLKGRQIGELSGGQKKRVFVARALAQGSGIILLDEPFAGVDIKTEDSLIGLFRDLAKEGRLILVSTHNLGSVPSFCDDVILINKEIIAKGPVATTFTQDNLAKAFGTMLRHHHLGGSDLHDDEDERRLTVLTDDERPLVLYGERGGPKIIPPSKSDGDRDNDNDNDKEPGDG